jgi:hypothetical protein
MLIPMAKTREIQTLLRNELKKYLGDDDEKKSPPSELPELKTARKLTPEEEESENKRKLEQAEATFRKYDVHNK